MKGVWPTAGRILGRGSRRREAAGQEKAQDAPAGYLVPLTIHAPHPLFPRSRRRETAGSPHPVFPRSRCRETAGSPHPVFPRSRCCETTDSPHPVFPRSRRRKTADSPHSVFPRSRCRKTADSPHPVFPRSRRRETADSPHPVHPVCFPFRVFSVFSGPSISTFAKQTHMRTETHKSLRRKTIRLESLRFSPTQSNPVKPSQSAFGIPETRYPKSDPTQSGSIRLLLSHPRGLRQKEDRICWMARAPRLLIQSSRVAAVVRRRVLLILSILFILSVFPFVCLAFLAGHPMPVFTKRTQIEKITPVFSMTYEMSGWRNYETNPNEQSTDCAERTKGWPAGRARPLGAPRHPPVWPGGSPQSAFRLSRFAFPHPAESSARRWAFGVLAFLSFFPYGSHTQKES